MEAESEGGGDNRGCGTQLRDFLIAHKTKYNNLSHYSVGNSTDNLGNIYCSHNIRNKAGGCMGMDSHNKKEQGHIPHIPSPKEEAK